MQEAIKVEEYAQTIAEAIPRGILLNTNADKFNSMVIGWGALGTVWGRPAFTVYVREHRYTKPQLDKTGEFSISVPLGKPVGRIAHVCGQMSGRNVDKVAEAGLTLAEPQVIHTPGIMEYPLTLECKVLYAQEQVIASLPTEIQEHMYPQDVDGTHVGSNRDAHTMYIGQIVAAYINR